jgi:hypothetical protein
MLNWKRFGKKRPWPNLRYYLGICLEGLRKATESLSQDSRLLGRDLNPEPSDYEAEVLITRLRRSVRLSRSQPKQRFKFCILYFAIKRNQCKFQMRHITHSLMYFTWVRILFSTFPRTLLYRSYFNTSRSQRLRGLSPGIESHSRHGSVAPCFCVVLSYVGGGPNKGRLPSKSLAFERMTENSEEGQGSFVAAITDFNTNERWNWTSRNLMSVVQINFIVDTCSVSAHLNLLGVIRGIYVWVCSKRIITPAYMGKWALIGLDWFNDYALINTPTLNAVVTGKRMTDKLIWWLKV